MPSPVKPSPVKPLDSYIKVLVNTPEEYTRMLAEIESSASLLGFDVETTSKNPMAADLVGASFYWGSGTAYYAPADIVIPQLEGLQRIFNSKMTVAHNIKYEAEVGHKVGYRILDGRWSCTQVEDYIIEPDGGHGLKACEERYFGWQAPTYEDSFGDEPLHLVPPERIYEYACIDAMGTYELHNYNIPRLAELREILQLDLAVVPVIVGMEMLGIQVDTDFLRSYLRPLELKIQEMRGMIFKHAGTEFEINSPAQVGEILHDVLKLPAQGGRTKTGKWKTSALALKQLERRHPIVPLISEYRELIKMRKNYVESILENLSDDKICRPSYLQCAVPTGRLASSKGNLTGGACNIQQIPKRGKILSSESKLSDEDRRSFESVGAKIEPVEDKPDVFKVELPVKPRRAFIPRRGYYILSADYKAIEFRIMVLVANERKIIDEILSGVDVHNATACDVFGITPDQVTNEQRDVAKMLNYAVLYGMDYHGLMTRLKITEEEARLIYNRFMLRIPNIQIWIKQVQEFAKKNHFVKTYFGRRRTIWDLIKYREIANPRERRALFSRGLRGSVNTVIQGTAADIMKMAMVRVDQAFKPFGDDTHLLASVHDQVLGEVKNHIPRNDMMGVVREAMQFPVSGWDLPMEVEFEIGENWGDCIKAYYEVPGRSGLEIRVKDGVTASMMKKMRYELSKFPGQKPVSILMNGTAVVCKEKVMAADDVALKMKGVFGKTADVAWV